MNNSFLLKDFGRKVRTLRENSGLSQEKLAGITGFHRTYIGMVERGERNLSLTNIAVFAKAFEMGLPELLTFSATIPSHDFENFNFKSSSKSSQ